LSTMNTTSIPPILPTAPPSLRTETTKSHPKISQAEMLLSLIPESKLMVTLDNRKPLPEDSQTTLRLLRRPPKSVSKRSTTTTNPRSLNSRRRTMMVLPRRTSLRTRKRESPSG
jgi:hypothetical protein